VTALRLEDLPPSSNLRAVAVCALQMACLLLSLLFAFYLFPQRRQGPPSPAGIQQCRPWRRPPPALRLTPHLHATTWRRRAPPARHPHAHLHHLQRPARCRARARHSVKGSGGAHAAGEQRGGHPPVPRPRGQPRPGVCVRGRSGGKGVCGRVCVCVRARAHTHVLECLLLCWGCRRKE